MGILGDCLEEIERQERIKNYFSNGGTLITEDAYSVIPEDSMFIGSFDVIEDEEPTPFSKLRMVCEGRSIGTFKKNRRFDVFVNANEGKNIKHFHIIAHDDSGDETCVQLGINQYFTHGNKTYTLNTKECKALNTFVNQPKSFGRFTMTTYEYIVFTWNDMNKDNFECQYKDSTDEPIIPNYSIIMPYK